MPTRRQLLQAGLGAVAGALASRMAFARLPSEKRFVFMLLRGGMDGLAAVPPLGDPDYADQRGALALGPEAGGLRLDHRFVLHPAMPLAHALYLAGEFAVVHAIAPPHRTRSHFDAQNVLEGGGVQAFQQRDGWLNRALAATGADIGGGLAIASALPLTMRGPQPVASWAPRQATALAESFSDRVRAMYADDPVLAPALARGLSIKATTEDGAMSRGRVQPTQALTLRSNAWLAADLLRAPDGPRVAMLEGGQWDTHAGQGLLQGRLPRLLGDLDGAFGALRDGLGPLWRETVVVAVTEFGRTVSPNGSHGTDHGYGSVAFVAGGAVEGGQVIADWPGMAPAALFEGRDLMATTDMRRLIKAVLADHMNLATANLDHDVFPESSGILPLRGLIRG